VINTIGCRGARLLVWLILNDRTQPSLIAGVWVCGLHSRCEGPYVLGRWAMEVSPPCKIHTVYVWRILQGGVTQYLGDGGEPRYRLSHGLSYTHTGDVRRVIRSAGNLCKIHRLLVRYST
jgi:hypothetical protein